MVRKKMLFPHQIMLHLWKSSQNLQDTSQMIFGICDWDISDASFRLTLIKYSLKSFGMVIWSKIFLLLRIRCFGSESQFCLYQSLPS